MDTLPLSSTRSSSTWSGTRRPAARVPAGTRRLSSPDRSEGRRIAPQPASDAASHSGSGAAPSRALVLAPAYLGGGGLGAAAADMVAGLRAQGLAVDFAGSSGRLGGARLLASRRPLRRLGLLKRELDRRDVRRRADGVWDLIYAMPGFVPDAARGVAVVHQATRHPRVVRRAVAAARRTAGGGRGFMTALEARRLERELGHAAVVRVESAAVGRELVRYGVPERRIVHAPPGIDLERFRPGEKSTETTVAFVGALSLWKGVDIVADLAEALHGRARVVVAGGPVCPWSRRLVKRARFERQSDVPGLLARSQLLVLPSAADGFAYVVLEAMASGCVPIVSPEVGSAEIVQRLDTRLVQPREHFVTAVGELLGTLALPELAARARTIAEEFERSRMASLAARQVLEVAGLPCDPETREEGGAVGGRA